MKQLTDELLVITIQLGVIEWLENHYQPMYVAQIVQANGAKWRERSLELIHEIENREAWFEGERKHQPIDTHDPIIMERVQKIIKENQSQLREKIYVENNWS